MEGTTTLDPDALAEVPLERIESEITGLAAHLAAAECRWLVLIGEFDRRQGGVTWGCKSTAHYLNWRCGVSMRAAYERVRVGRALLSLPAVREAFAKGELSYSKVRAITRIACPENEAELVELARHATASQVERIGTVVAKVVEQNAEARRLHAERFLRFSWADDGSLLIWAKLAPEAGALVLEALQAVVEEIDLETFVAGHDAEVDAEEDTEVGDDRHQDHPGVRSAEHSAATSDPSDPFSARYADGLVRMAETVLRQGTTACTDRYRVSIHADLLALFGLDDGSIELPNGVPLAPSVVERLLCDCDTVPVLEIDGQPVYVGSKAATIPRRLRRQVTARDRHCRFPGCDEARFVEVHHVVWRSRGGPTELWNLVLLCRFHHTLIHQRGFSIRALDGELAFSRPDGTAIPEAPSMRALGDDLAVQHRLAGLAIGPDTILSAWDGHPLDLYGLDVAVAQFARHLAERPAEHHPNCRRSRSAEVVAA